MLKMLFGTAVKFFGGLSTRTWLIIGAGALLTILTGLAWHALTMFFENQQRSIQNANTAGYNQAQTEVIATAVSKQLQDLRSQVDQESKRLNDLRAEFAASRKDVERIDATLKRHNLQQLMQSKPGLVVKRANDATDKVWQQFEELNARAATTEQGN